MPKFKKASEYEDQEQVAEAAAPAPAMSVSAQDLAQALATALQAIQPPRDQGYAEVAGKDVFNPSGRKRELKRDTYVNHFRVDVRYLHDQEVALLDQVKPGRYLDGKVTVSEQHGEGGRSVIHIQYPDKGIEDRLMMKSVAPNFATLIQRVVSEGSKASV